MSVRVLDDEPGYALLVFDTPNDCPELKLAIKSLQVGQGAYLDPSGAWLKAPHFFATQRTEAQDGRTGYRLGPEVVNHMLDQDWIEVSSEDGSLREEGVWENATPLMQGHQSRLAPPSPPPPRPLPPPPPPCPSPPPVPEPLSPAPSLPLPLSDVPQAEIRKLPRWLPLVVMLALLPLAALALIPDVRCRVLGSGCPSPGPELNLSEQDMAQQVRQCAQRNEAEDAYCSIGEICFASYRAQFPNGSSKPEIDRLAAREAELCEKSKAELRLLTAAKQCAAANPCGAQGCYHQYWQSYPNGTRADEARAVLAKAQRDCRPTVSPKPTPSETPLPDGVYSAQSRAGCGAARQFGLSLSVHGGRISWQHDAPLVPRGPPVSMLWEGSIDGDGNIKASVGNSPGFVAQGRYFEAQREVEMHYPNCTEVVTLTISGMRTK